ncbi:uncharacterized protein HMPREF1541_09152 [Cyphellophora europaea CBS 101466]|uniref:Nitrogen permease regulator 3 n=1 Tax=Cyphellophora europaea (strain CBS 101466) TaxID=1220924 RepID=W2S9C1_CYPE1|nr:uncharacterized protein HMPREF1541_09152 [Cyphellophora europaea CBS 101466]ETN45321.1 hypothetical protein HMPREF1541_09152 [Cyphellophora europaea CBS 101466]
MAGAPNPGLLGVLLVAQTRSGTGAQVLFHYPPDPLADDEGQLPDTEQAAVDESSSSDSDSESSSDDNVFDVTPLKLREGPRHAQDDRSPVTEDDEDEQNNKLSKLRSSENWEPSWEPLLGIGEEGLVSLLAPGRAWHKRKFELGINDLVFVGRPVYAHESGSWQKRRRKKSKKPLPDEQNDTIDSALEMDASEQDANAEKNSKSALTMFHVVFVMNPSPLEHATRVRDMYDNVARKLSKVLKSEQTRNDYVCAEADLIQNIKSSHFTKRSPTATLYSDLLKQSTLATALASTYRAISKSRIAAITLSSDISISLQIPPLTSTPYLPSLTEPPIQPGLWLTTANEPTSSSDLETANTTSALQLAKSFTLLLREPPHKILKDIQSTGGALPQQLVDFITTLRPNKSFHKISQATHLPLADIQLLSRHLIYWRRAIAIPPLHHRDTYIVSPNADMASLPAASAAFSSSFPMLPSLPRLLSLLSAGPPTPFGTLIPSSDHKEEYYRVLAWLLCGGWVTQLRTFGFVIVSPAVKAAVRQQEHNEKLSSTQRNLERLDLHSPNSQNQPQYQPSSTAASSLSSTTTTPSHPRRPNLPSRPSSDHTSTTTTSRHHPHQSTHNPTHASLIPSPLRATPLESSWLSYIHASLLQQQQHLSSSDDNAADGDLHLSDDADKADVHRAWPILLKYLNGKEALEGMAVREGLKRKQVWEVLGRVGVKWGWEVGGLDEGIEVGGEGMGGGKGKGQGERSGVVMSVRHW